MSRLTLARIVVAIGGLFSALVLLAMLMVGTVMSTYLQGTSFWSFLPAFAIVLGYCILVVRALRGHRLAVVIVTVAAWLLVSVAVQWTVDTVKDPYALDWPTVSYAPAAVLYAVAATYLMRSAPSRRSSGNERARLNRRSCVAAVRSCGPRIMLSTICMLAPTHWTRFVCVTKSPGA
jgi:hypothetical protein